MTNKPMLSVERELLERVTTEANYMLGFTSASNYDECRKAVDELRAILDKPAAQHYGDPVAWRGCNADGEVVTEWIDGVPPGRMTDLCGSAASFEKIERAYAEQAAPVACGTTSDKYKAELYDEVWQLARSMGFNNVTDAMTGRVSPTEPDSECTSCDGSGEYTDAIGDWRGYCTCPAGVEAEELKGVKP